VNILFICDEYPPGENGGIGTTVQILGRELARQGHSVFVAGLYTYRYGQKDYEEDQGVKVWRLRYGLNLGTGRDNKLYKAVERMPRAVKRLLSGQKAFDRFTAFIKQLIAKENIDVIEAPDFNSFAMHLGIVVQWPTFSVPFIIKSHGSYTYLCMETGKIPDRHYEQADRLLYSRADAVCCVSHYNATQNQKLFKIPAELTVIYNGINSPQTVPTHPKKKCYRGFYRHTGIHERHLLLTQSMEYRA